MARTPGTSARIQRLTALVAMLLVATVIGFAIGRVFEGRATTLLFLATGAVSALLAVAFERRSVLLTVLVGLVVLIFGVSLVLFSDTTWYALPTLDTLRAAGEAASQVGEQARLQISPAPAVVPLVFATMLAVWAAVFSAHALAFRAGSPILALLPPLALIAFADSVLDELEKPIYGIVFLVAGLGILFADGLRRVQGWGPVWNGPGRRDRLLPTAGFQARRLAAGVVALAVVAPLVVPGFGSNAVIDLTAINRDGGVTVSTLVSMASTLNGGERKMLFDVETAVPSYYRMTALERFDGVSWMPAETTARAVSSGEDLLIPPVGARTFTQKVTLLEDYGAVDDLGTFLPVGYAPSSVEASADLSWDVDTQSVSVEGGLEEGDTYQVTSTYLAPDPEDLRRAGILTGLDPELTILPEGFPQGIGDLAREWVAGSASDYDAVMAIQERLTGGEFRYSKSVAYREDSGTILEFLTSAKRGFCQQFATAMAVLLRSLGIPARVAVGFTSGQARPDRTYRVSTTNLHSWVEVPFVGYGWLAFEPTPTRTNPTAASYLAEDQTPVCPSGRPCGEPGGGARGQDRRLTPEQLCRQQIADGRGLEGLCDPGGTGLPEPAPVAAEVPWMRYGLLGGVLMAVLGLLGMPAGRWWRRRRTLRRAGSAPRRLILANYDVFSQRAAIAGLARRPGETPSEWERRLLESGRVAAEHVGPLTALAVRAAYGRGEPTHDEALDAIAAAHTASQTLQRSLSVRERVRAVYRRR